MPGVQPVHRAVFGAGPGAYGEDGGGRDGNAGGDRAHADAARGGGETLLQREAFEAGRPGAAAALPVGFAAGFADEYRDEVSGPGGPVSVHASGELAEFAQSARAQDGGGAVDVGGLRKK